MGWSWSSGQLARLLLQLFEFETRQRIEILFCKNRLKSTENNRKMGNTMNDGQFHNREKSKRKLIKKGARPISSVTRLGDF